MKRLRLRIEEGVHLDVVVGILHDYESWQAIYG